MALIAPSIVAADWARLREALEMIASAGASVVHVDVMDGHFIPDLSVGVPVVASLRNATELAIDVHLLVERPDRFVGDFLEAGAHRICVHYEATHHLPRLLDFIRAKNALAGVAVTYPTPVEAVSEILDHIDFLTILCGQPMLYDHRTEFIPRSADKIRSAARMRKDRRLDFAIQAEGGLGPENLDEVARAGADILVMGSAIFKSVDPQAQLKEVIRVAARIHRATAV